MTGDSITRPGGGVCAHPKWKKVEGTCEADGSQILVCDKCGATIKTRPPVMEKSKDPRPLLQE